MATSSSPNDGRGADLAIFHWHLDAFLLSISLEHRVAISLVVAEDFGDQLRSRPVGILVFSVFI